MQNLLLESQTTNSSILLSQDSYFDSSSSNQFTTSTPLLQQYRTYKPNTNFYIKDPYQKYYLPQFCTFFNQKSIQNIQTTIQCKCHCNKTQDHYCELIMKWIEEQYYWKTDRQFFKLYDNYLNKKTDGSEQRELSTKLKQKIKILGLKMPTQQFLTLIQILSNYKKHAIYYNKSTKLLTNSDIYIWAVLGIWYHIGSQNQSKKTLIFWALDIIMQCFQDLTPSTLKIYHKKCLKRFQHYYSKWISVLNTKGININIIIWQWMNQLMFGYIGIQSIAFLLDCYKKSGWDFIFKVMLSYFEHRACHIKKNIAFLTGNINTQQLYKLLLDGKQQWPLVFCTASSFVYRQ